MDRALVLSTPRTGSVLVSESIHAHLLSRNKDALYLGEFLNQHLYPLYMKELDAIRTQLQYIHPREGTYRLKPLLEKGTVVWEKLFNDSRDIDLGAETQRRLEILRNVEVPYVLKHHAYTDELSNEVLKFRNDLIVVVRRSNTWKQILSQGFAFHAKRFKYTDNTRYFDVKPRSIILSRNAFDTIVFRIKQLEKLIPSLVDKAAFLWYEDIKDMPRKEILRKMGLEGMVDISDKCVSTPYLIPIEDYYDSDYLKELKVWYKETFKDFRQWRDVKLS